MRNLTMSQLTQEYLTQLLNYDPDSGVFTWLVDQRQAGLRAGHQAGCETRKRRIICIDYRNYPEHHLAWLFMTGSLPAEQINHANRRTSDNRWRNLRAATHQENCWTRGKYRNNTSGYKGVSWNKRKHLWRAYIKADAKQEHLGYFETKENAARSYNAAAIKYFGKFAMLNVVLEDSDNG
jgi:hypothetical protein